MQKFRTADEFLKFERRWKFVYTVFAVLLAGAIFLFVFWTPTGINLVWCIVVAAVSLVGARLAAIKLRDPDRQEAIRNGLDVLGGDD